MKTIKKQLKPITLIFSILIFFQSCTVYKSSPVTIEEAYKTQNTVKVRTKDNQTFKFKKIELENGKYFGLKKIFKNDAFDASKEEIIKIQLEENNIEIIKIKNKKLSTILPFAIPIVLLGSSIVLYTMPTW